MIVTITFPKGKDIRSEIGRAWRTLEAWALIRFAKVVFASQIPFKKAVPFFPGVIPGDFIIGGLWSIIGIGLHRSMYQFLL